MAFIEKSIYLLTWKHYTWLAFFNYYSLPTMILQPVYYIHQSFLFHGMFWEAVRVWNDEFRPKTKAFIEKSIYILIWKHFTATCLALFNYHSLPTMISQPVSYIHQSSLFYGMSWEAVRVWNDEFRSKTMAFIEKSIYILTWRHYTDTWLEHFNYRSLPTMMLWKPFSVVQKLRLK